MHVVLLLPPLITYIVYAAKIVALGYTLTGSIIHTWSTSRSIGDRSGTGTGTSTSFYVFMLNVWALRVLTSISLIQTAFSLWTQ